MAAPTNVYRGVGVHFGTSSSTAFASGQFKLQTRDHELKSESEAIKDGNGITVGKVFFDQMQEATLEYIPVSSGSINGTLTPTLSAVGDLVTITDSVYTAIAGSTWLVESVSTKSSNTTAMRVTLKLANYGSITS